MSKPDILLACLFGFNILGTIVHLVHIRSGRLIGPRGARGIPGETGPMGPPGVCICNTAGLPVDP
jgi:hypothetical protein